MVLVESFSGLTMENDDVVSVIETLQNLNSPVTILPIEENIRTGKIKHAVAKRKQVVSIKRN